MYFQKRHQRYSFIYYDTTLRKNVRLKWQETVHIQTDLKAEEFCRQWDIQNDAVKYRLQEKQKWRNRFHAWISLLKSYEKVRH